MKKIADKLLSSPEKSETIKCVVWDLDNTIWNGILLEGDAVTLREGMVDIIKALDRRGILQSIASRNDEAAAMKQLLEMGLEDYFLYPQINWSPKSQSVKTIAESINIGLDSLMFVDDQAFELEEVRFVHPQVRTVDANDLENFLQRTDLQPRFITEDSRRRRHMYRADIHRKSAEENFSQGNEEFLASLNMRLTIHKASEDDLQRAEELTVRTNQLNATGYTYSYEELNTIRQSNSYKLLIAELEDKFGTYGKIGLVLLECDSSSWKIKLLLMSCRVMSRGVGAIMLNHIIERAQAAKVKLIGEFVPTDRNRPMYISYKFAGFQEIGREDNVVILENTIKEVPNIPDYVNLQSEF